MIPHPQDELSAMQRPTCTNIRIRSIRDAHVIFHAVSLGLLPMITRRLDADERLALRSGCVYVWEERAAHSEVTGLGIERFTEGRRWGASRVRDEFLFYYEKSPPTDFQGKENPDRGNNQKTWDPLVKQTYSVWVETQKGRRKWHITAYFTQTTVNSLNTIDDIPHLRNLEVPPGEYRSTRINKARRAEEIHTAPTQDVLRPTNVVLSRTYAPYPLPVADHNGDAYLRHDLPHAPPPPMEYQRDPHSRGYHDSAPPTLSRAFAPEHSLTLPPLRSAIASDAPRGGVHRHSVGSIPDNVIPTYSVPPPQHYSVSQYTFDPRQFPSTSAYAPQPSYPPPYYPNPPRSNSRNHHSRAYSPYPSPHSNNLPSPYQQFRKPSSPMSYQHSTPSPSSSPVSPRARSISTSSHQSIGSTAYSVDPIHRRSPPSFNLVPVSLPPSSDTRESSVLLSPMVSSSSISLTPLNGIVPNGKGGGFDLAPLTSLQQSAARYRRDSFDTQALQALRAFAH